MKDTKAENESGELGPRSALVLYQTEDGTTRIQCRFEGESIWLTQALIATLFGIKVHTVNEHLKGIYGDGEVRPEATIRSFRIVRSEGARQVARDIEHYGLEAILAVGTLRSAPARAGRSDGRSGCVEGAGGCGEAAAQAECAEEEGRDRQRGWRVSAAVRRHPVRQGLRARQTP